MKITILTYGSRGDVQPFLALALGLQKAGHAVKLAAPQRFADFISDFGISFFPLAGDPEVISKRLNIAGAHPIRMIRAVSDYVFSIGDRVVYQAAAACSGAEFIVHSFLFTTGGHSLAQKLGVPDASVQTFPIFAPTRAIPPVYLPNLPCGVLRQFFHWLTIKIFWYGGNLGYNQIRRNLSEGLNLRLYWPFTRREGLSNTPLILACSPAVIPYPDDWSGSNIYVPGYFILDESASYDPPNELKDFLATGEPPVCVTFGSTIYNNPEYIYANVLQALRISNSRAIILSGWSDIRKIELPDNVIVMDSAPHDWLLPRCKVIIHHGGAGTTAAGLRAGIPNIIVPSAADQPFWGSRVYALGAGPKPILAKKLSWKKLVSALQETNTDQIRNRAYDIGRTIRAETGVSESVKLIEKTIAQWRKSDQLAINHEA